MENKFLNSIVQAKSPLIGGPIIEYQRDILYFIRTSEENGEEGFLYLNGKKYGNVAEIYERIKEIETELSGISSGTSYAEVLERLKNDEVIINASKDAVEDLDERVSELENNVSANTDAITILKGDESVTGSVDQKIKEAIDNLPTDMVVEGGSVIEISGVTYLSLKIRGQEEPVLINASKLIDTYTNGDAYVNVKDYQISLNIDKIKEALELSKYATKEETEKITNKVNEVISALTDVQINVEGLSNDIDEVSAQTKNAQDTADLALETAQSAKTTAEEVKSEIVVLSGTVIDNQSDIDNLEDEVDELSGAVKTLDEEIIDINEALSGIQEDIVTLSGAISGSQEALTAISATVITLSSETVVNTENITIISGDVITLSGEVTSIKEDVESISGDIETLTSEVSANTENIEVLSGEVSNNAEDIESISGDLETLATEVSGNTENIETLSGEVISVIEKIETVSGEVVSNKENIEAISGDVETLTNEVSANTENINVLSSITENNITDIQTVSGNVIELSSSVVSINDNLDVLSASVVDDEIRIEDNEDAISALTVEVAILNGDETVDGSVDKKIKDAIDNLPSDMFVESGRVEKSGDTEYLVLKIKGQEEELYIDATALVDTYTNGDEYIKVENYEISLNVDALKKALGIENLATKTELEEVIDKLNDTISGLTAVQDIVEQNSLDIETLSGSVDEIDEKISELSSKTITLEAGTGIEISGSSISANTNATTTEDIQVTVDLGAGFTKGTTIPSGTSVQDLLVKLLSKELWATSVTTGKTFTASVGKPSASLDKSGTVEVGTVVTFTSNASTAYTSAQTVTAKTMTYGYYDGSKEATLNTATTYTETLSPTKSGDVVLATSYTGFTNATAETVTATSVTVTGLTVSEGSNSASVKETGATVYAQTNVTEKTLYVATNLKNTTKSATDSSDWTVTIPATWNGTASIATSNNNSASVTGAYKYYYGFAPMGLANTLDNLTDAQIYAMSNGWITKDGTTTLVANDSAKAVLAEGNIVIAVPSKYKLASILEKLSGNSILENFKSEKRTLNIGGTSTTEYTVYYYSVAAAPTYYDVTITKA